MRLPLITAALLVVAPALVGCTQNATTSTARDRGLSVSSTDSRCDISASEAPAGTVTFDVTNDGSGVTEFYLLGAEDERTIGEVENIGPGLTRQLVVRVADGDYLAVCKPGMKGDGIRQAFTVTPSDEKVDMSAAGDVDALIEEAEQRYQTYVHEESGQLLAGTEEFVTAYKAGDDKTARALYPVVRTHWERIETVAESFGDLDPKMDAREADLEPGQKWTGWHRMEKDLWPARAEKYADLTTRQRALVADDLLANTRILDGRIVELSFPIDQIANGSRALLEEVATGKVTGEEEYWSRTDLWDFQANVEGAHEAFEVLEPVLELKDRELKELLDGRFHALQDLLDEQRVGDGFRSYDELSTAEVKRLADAVNALGEPLSRLTAAVLS